jgi:hypothetical protein
MPDGTLASNSAQPADNIVAGNATGLIDNYETVHPTTLDDPDRLHTDALLPVRTSERNSARVSFWRKQPTMAEVTVDEFCFSMPRIIMHR